MLLIRSPKGLNRRSGFLSRYKNRANVAGLVDVAYSHALTGDGVYFCNLEFQTREARALPDKSPEKRIFADFGTFPALSSLAERIKFQAETTTLVRAARLTALKLRAQLYEVGRRGCRRQPLQH